MPRIRTDSKAGPADLQTCGVRMTDLKGHIYHKKRKGKCPKCGRVRMQGRASKQQKRVAGLISDRQILIVPPPVR